MAIAKNLECTNLPLEIVGRMLLLQVWDTDAIIRGGYLIRSKLQVIRSDAMRCGAMRCDKI